MSRQFAEILLREQLINAAQLQAADEAFKSSRENHNAYLLRNNAYDETKALEIFSQRYSIPSFDLAKYAIPEDVVALFKREDVRKYRMIPIQKAKGTLVVATYDPTALQNIDDVRFKTQLQVEAVFTTSSAFNAALDKHYGAMQSIEGLVGKEEKKSADSVEELSLGSDTMDVNEGDIDAPIIQLVNSILVEAIKRKASDIHVEPYEYTFRIRFRIDGVLYEIMKPPVSAKPAVIARLKIMSKMDIAEKRLPQDGRIKIRTPLGEMDYRVSSMPTIFGEKIVLRLLSKSGLQADLAKLGFDKHSQKLFEEGIRESYGMVLVTGPTGSGKTTTLYSALSELNKVTDNISTAEDPVEYNLEGINQVQTHSDIGLNFAAALKTFLRQDPDIILVGEIRDYETAEVSVQAALTGHLVLSTLHTNDAPSTITRMLNMGIEPFLVTAAVHLIVAQRLIRKICDQCKTVHKVPVERLTELGIDPQSAAKIKIYRGTGCENCSNTGYQGRFPIFEVMRFSQNQKEAVLRGANSLELKKLAVQEGMRTLRMFALQKVAEGLTTLDEALTNTRADF